ncbi:hypothetical protein Hanom_Chr02g00170801 [Helianthus anomalus]
MLHISIFKEENIPSQLQIRSYSPAYISISIPCSKSAGIPTSRSRIQSFNIA